MVSQRFHLQCSDLVGGLRRNTGVWWGKVRLEGHKNSQKDTMNIYIVLVQAM